MELIYALLQVLQQHSTICWFLVIAFLFWLAEMFTNILGHWHHTFDKINFSAMECYEKIEQGLKDREIPGLHLSRKVYRQTVLIGARREYLRVSRGDNKFDICVSPFGTGMFASWWFVNETNRFIRLIRRLPIISFFYSFGTYYQVDSELMFEDIVHLVVLEALDAMTEEHGTRMNEYERRIQDPSQYNVKRR